VAELFYTTRVYYFDSPVPIVYLHKIIPLHQFNYMTAIRILFCSNYAHSRVSEFNAETFQSALKILQQMPNLQSFHILLAHECWRDHFFLKAHPKGHHPYHVSEFNTYPSRFLTPIAWFVTFGETEWLRPGDINFDLRDIVPYLQWAKDIPCHGEVVVQLHIAPKLYADHHTVDYSGARELRLKHGEFIVI
jgi:hypothetical protein